MNEFQEKVNPLEKKEKKIMDGKKFKNSLAAVKKNQICIFVSPPIRSPFLGQELSNSTPKHADAAHQQNLVFAVQWLFSNVSRIQTFSRLLITFLCSQFSSSTFPRLSVLHSLHCWAYVFALFSICYDCSQFGCMPNVIWFLLYFWAGCTQWVTFESSHFALE